MSRISSLPACALALLLAAAPAHAQEFTWTQTSSFRIGNMPGIVARMLGSGRETVETSYLGGHRLRTETGNNASIIDVDAGHIITLDTRAKTYTRVTFEEMAESLRQLEQDAQAGRPARGEEGEYEFRFSAGVDVTGEREQIGGYDAQRSLIHVTVTPVPKDERQRREMEERGTLAILVDTWNSTAAPHGAALHEFQQAYAERMAREMDSMRGLQMLFAQNPGMKEGWEAAIAELKKVDGVPVRTNTYIVSVPAGMEFDRQLVLAPPAEEKESTGGRVSRGIAGRLRAAAGQPTQEEPSERPTRQSTIITLLSELREVRSGGVPAGAFDIPAGFREVKPKP